MPGSPDTEAAAALIRFLLSRIDEDQATVDKLSRAEARGPDTSMAAPGGLRSVERLRLELVTKRHMIGDLQQLLVLRDLPNEAELRRVALHALTAMTAPYAEHRAFRAEWTRSTGSVKARKRHPVPDPI